MPPTFTTVTEPTALARLVAEVRRLRALLPRAAAMMDLATNERGGPCLVCGMPIFLGRAGHLDECEWAEVRAALGAPAGARFVLVPQPPGPDDGWTKT